MLSQQQWSGLTRQEIDGWLSNFDSLGSDNREFAYKILVNLLYFSEKDVINTLREGVYKCVGYDAILAAQTASSFSLSNHSLCNIYNGELSATIFLPLSDNDSPHESGNYVSRLLVQQNIIPVSNSIYADRLPEVFIKDDVKNVIIVDDCLGSGDQITSFWTTKRITTKDGTQSINELCKANGVVVKYLTLFGYKNSIDELKVKHPELKIHCMRYLTDQQRVFSDSSYIWSCEDERKKAFEFFRELTQEIGIPLLGYRGLDFAFIMHQTIPDWSLPLLWKNRSHWNKLLGRKNSND